MAFQRTIRKISSPLAVKIPDCGVFFAESTHDIDFQMAWRKDPFHKLIYLLKGASDYEEEGRRGELSEGSFIAIPEGLNHRITDRVASTLLLLCISDEFLAKNRESGQLWKLIVNHSQKSLQPYRSMNQQIENLWRRAMVEQKALQIGSSAIISCNAIQILVSLGRLHPSKAPEKAVERVKALISKIEETFYEEWSIDRASTEVSLSRRQFCSLFHQVTGLTFIEKLLRIRLAHAATLLTEGRSSIAGVAFSCGYQDISHFYRLFVRRYKLPPKKWQAQHSTKV